VTSALPGEGKSTIAATLAQALARAGERVVLVDCDLRVARLTKVFASKSSAGLRDIVTNQLSAQSAMKHHEAGFMFLAAGGEAHSGHPSEIFTATDARILFEELRMIADYIIVDLPPLNPIADTRGVSRLVDSYLLVIEWGETTVQVVEQSLDTASTVKDRMQGVVLNKVDLEQLGNYDGAYVSYENYYPAAPIYSLPRPTVIQPQA
jgi:capsular exopolysaccharide synthesis family protein